MITGCAPASSPSGEPEEAAAEPACPIRAEPTRAWSAGAQITTGVQRDDHASPRPGEYGGTEVAIS